MPGPVSDSYDPQWSTSSNAEDIREELGRMHTRLGDVIGSPPKYILEVVHGDEGPIIGAQLSERDWRILRFACEKAKESI